MLVRTAGRRGLLLEKGEKSLMVSWSDINQPKWLVVGMVEAQCLQDKCLTLLTGLQFLAGDRRR